MTPQQLKSWRKRLGLSQKAASEAIGVSHRQLWAYEAGEADIPLTVELACAAVALGLRKFPEAA